MRPTVAGPDGDLNFLRLKLNRDENDETIECLFFDRRIDLFGGRLRWILGTAIAGSAGGSRHEHHD